MGEYRETYKSRKGIHKLPVYPADHKVGMEVPLGGSNCDKCEYLKHPQVCGESHFIQWNGSSLIPIPTEQYCCDFFETKGK